MNAVIGQGRRMIGDRVLYRLPWRPGGSGYHMYAGNAGDVVYGFGTDFDVRLTSPNSHPNLAARAFSLLPCKQSVILHTSLRVLIRRTMTCACRYVYVFEEPILIQRVRGCYRTVCHW